MPRNPNSASPSTTKGLSPEAVQDILNGKTPYYPASAGASQHHHAMTAAPNAPKAKTKSEREHVSSRKRADGEQIRFWGHEHHHENKVRVREAKGVGNMPVKRPALVRQVASDVLPKPPARPSLATNRTDTFPLSVQHRHQSFDSQATQVPPSPPPQPVGAGDRSTPHFTNPFDNNKPLEPLARLPRSDYKPLPKKFLRPGGYKPPKTTAEKISGICPSWIYHPKPALPEFDEKRIRPVKDDISPFDTSMMEDKRLLKRVHGESNLCNKYRQAVEQSPTPSHARQHQVKEAKR